METEAAWTTVEGGHVVDEAFRKTASAVAALRLELARGPRTAS